MFGRKIKMVAKTIYGMEDILRQELEDLNAKNIKVLNRAVEFEGDLELMYTANLKLRTALSILTPLFHFKAETAQDIYDNVLQYDWGRIFNLHQTFAIYSVVHSQTFTHSQYVSLKTKDAIADHFRKKYNARPNVDTRFADIRIVLHVTETHFSVALDTSGKALFQRGYKTSMTEAPINEVLAAGIILKSGWDKKTPFIDLMCGSGTFLIEAAMIASNCPANLYRKRFGFQNFRNYDALLWDSIVEKAESEISSELPPIIGNDISDEVIEKAQENINNTRFKRDIKLECSHFTNFENTFDEGIIITNPPYDERLKEDNIIELYQDLGDMFKQEFKNFDCWVFSANLEALKRLGLKPNKKIKLLNGSLEGSLQKFEIYEGSKKLSKQIKEEE